MPWTDLDAAQHVIKMSDGELVTREDAKTTAEGMQEFVDEMRANPNMEGVAAPNYYLNRGQDGAIHVYIKVGTIAANS